MVQTSAGSSVRCQREGLSRGKTVEPADRRQQREQRAARGPGSTPGPTRGETGSTPTAGSGGISSGEPPDDRTGAGRIGQSSAPSRGGIARGDPHRGQVGRGQPVRRPRRHVASEREVDDPTADGGEVVGRPRPAASGTG